MVWRASRSVLELCDLEKPETENDKACNRVGPGRTLGLRLPGAKPPSELTVFSDYSAKVGKAKHQIQGQ
jgi:hypothetical protein